MTAVEIAFEFDTDCRQRPYDYSQVVGLGGLRFQSRRLERAHDALVVDPGGLAERQRRGERLVDRDQTERAFDVAGDPEVAHPVPGTVPQEAVVRHDAG